jgi:hypothetical protein
LPQTALFHEVLQHLKRRNIGQFDFIVVDLNELRTTLRPEIRFPSRVWLARK